MPSSITIIAATLCAVASAIPHVHRHRHAHHHLLKDLAGRDLTDGVCGGSSAFTCAPGYCCSAWGYCGQTSDYCGTGCQSQWGQCGSKAATSPAETAPAGETPTLPSVATTFEPSTAYAPSTFATSTSAAPVSTSEAATVSSIDPSAYTTSPSASGWDTTSTTSSAAASTSSTSSSSSGLGDIYKMYTGDGSTSAGWPAQSSWASFDDLWTANTAVIAQSCTQFSAPNNSDDETSHLRSAISAVAASSGIDARFILAIVLQESGGCVRAPTSNYGVTNPGLMQSHDGTGSCND
ncbi:A-agglutinin anchorage subunit-like, partial [Teratosphaeria destructans]